MRLSRLETPDLKPLLERAEPLIARVQPMAERAREEIARLDPYVDRLRPHVERIGTEVRKHPRLAAGLDKIAGTWAQLVEAFCQTIDPTLARFFPDRRLVALTTDTDDLAIHSIVKGEMIELRPLGTIGSARLAEIGTARWSGIELRLRPDQVLRRTLSLPAASRDFLSPIINHRLERLTPWTADKVLFGYAVAEAETAGTVGVMLVATSRDTVAGPLRKLAEAGLVPTAIGAESETMAAPLRINLLQGGAEGSGGVAGASGGSAAESRRFVSRVALASLAVLFLLTLFTAYRASAARGYADAVDAKLVKARRLLRNASLGNVGARERALLDAKQPERAMVVLIDKLAGAIPKDTYLKELSVTPDKVHLVGTSANAPALVREIETTGLTNVRFTSSITRERDGRDSFEITADRAPGAAAKVDR